jgi:hypothetical protein
MFGADEDRASWLAGHRVRATDSLPALRNALRTKRPDVSDPESVFTWLSGHVHLTKDAVMANHSSAERRLGHPDAYAALAYVCWACAVMAEIGLGYDDIAEWPKRWPHPLPWDPSPPNKASSP